MKVSPDQPHDDMLEAYLDGLLDDDARAAFEERLRRDPELQRQVDLQQQVDAQLQQRFAVDAPSSAKIAAGLTAASAQDGRDERRSATSRGVGGAAVGGPRATPWYWAAAGVAAAAVVGWVLVYLGGDHPRDDAPVFTPRPVAQIYRSAVDAGFEPSYVCEEPERFADTFRQRLGRPLQLLADAGDFRMLGLAYTPGLSPQTTAMLCRVDGEPVMVFVDRAEADRELAVHDAGGELRVFRDERDGLVFYEVTPLDEPRVTPLLQPLAASGDSA